MQNVPDMSELMRLAQSPAGQQLLAMLQNSGGEALNTAIAQASAGNFHEAKHVLSSLLSTPRAQELLKQLEEHT